MFLSRKMLCLDKRVSEALTLAYEKSVLREDGTNSERSQFEWSVERINMNLFRFERKQSASLKLAEALASSASKPYAEASKRQREILPLLQECRLSPNACPFSNTAALQRLISVIMQDIQQRNLNAKHCTSTTRNSDNGVLDDAKCHDGATNCSYIQLNRSCNQRKYIELCCIVYNLIDLEYFQRNLNTVVILHSWLATTATDVEHDTNTFTRNDHTQSLVYGVIEKKLLAETLAQFRQLPRLVFVSCKSTLFVGGNGMNLLHISQLTDTHERMCRRLVYVANFIAYHIYHESNRSFDSRQFGVRHRHMRGLLFLLALVNVELLHASDGRNPNLALNMQSLGKAYNDVGLHIFAENSIQHVNKATSADTTGSTVISSLASSSSSSPSSVPSTVEINTDEEPPAAKLTKAKTTTATKAIKMTAKEATKYQLVQNPTPPSWEFATNGLLVNRCLGRVSEVGINAVSLKRHLQ